MVLLWGGNSYFTRSSCGEADVYAPPLWTTQCFSSVDPQTYLVSSIRVLVSIVVACV